MGHLDYSDQQWATGGTNLLARGTRGAGPLRGLIGHPDELWATRRRAMGDLDHYTNQGTQLPYARRSRCFKQKWSGGVAPHYGSPHQPGKLNHLEIFLKLSPIIQAAVYLCVSVLAGYLGSTPLSRCWSWVEVWCLNVRSRS